MSQIIGVKIHQKIDCDLLIHLDLKGAPPKVSYLEQLFPLFREWGATGLLLEWEDTFPYTRDLTPIGSNSPSCQGSAYSTEEARLILQLAGEAGLAVVPLVQTFGHLEFVLKHDNWRHLREVEAYPSSMCPSHPGAVPLVTSLIRQIVEFHPDIQFIHIGADEVWHMGLCGTCIKRLETCKYGKAELYLEHVMAILQFIRDTYSPLKVIMWDDMLRSIDIAVLKDLWDKYSCVFNNVWMASAFKGATGSCQILPVIQHHISNHEQWLLVLGREVNKFSRFRGMAFTGWSRYDHYATLCELLTVALPSLALCLKVWISGSFNSDLHTKVATALGFLDAPLNLSPFPRPQPVPQHLNFPGWKVFVGLEWFANLRVKFRSIVESDQVETWLNPWQIQHGSTNPMQIENLIPAFTDLMFEISSLESYLRVNMEDSLYSSTIDEWLGTNIEPLKSKLRQLKKDAEAQMSLGARCQRYRSLI
ncbi:Hexosaminidase domain-containing protein [Gryllus bimaculatus]|nr:Hexosaminidase domain-containing protein [Gryllus bimaculatus]